MLALIPISFISGILTVLSPCILPILPIILVSGIDGNRTRIRGLITGLVVSFTITMLSLATIVRLLGVPADTVRTLAVMMLVIFGLTLLLPALNDRLLSLIEQIWPFKPQSKTGSGFWGGFVAGVSLGLVWSPCVGPVLASVATFAALGEFSLSQLLVTLSYSLGVAVPLYLIATKAAQLTVQLNWLKSHNQEIRQVFGLLVLVTALMIWSGADRALQAWTLDNLPQSWTQVAVWFEERFLPDNVL